MNHSYIGSPPNVNEAELFSMAEPTYLCLLELILKLFLNYHL